VEAAHANLATAEAMADDAMLTLLGDLARDYVELRGTQARIATARVTIAMQRRANDLAARRFDGGDGSKLEELQGGTALLQLEAELPLLEAQARVLVNALSVLCGEPPETLRAQLLVVGPIPEGPAPLAGIPADLIRRRPDVRAAERRLAAAVALIGAAQAEKYPALSLSGNLSFSGGSLAKIMTLPLFALSPRVTFPILDGGQRDAFLAGRLAQAEQARFGYRTAVLTALREVEDAMAHLQGQSLHRDQLKRAIVTARKAVDIANKLYQLGAVDFLQVLYAQRALSQSEDALAQAEAARTIQVVALFKALGGGWQAP
jgi:NodT family efflux transporter outer membrane factor (OMF) lipoprotein